MTDVYDDDLFEAATDEFPSKFHLRDRLVAIYPNGKSGSRQGENGKPYDWYETTTVVLDDGPNGWSETSRDDHGNDIAQLVPSVESDGAQVLRGFQWSAAGLTNRLAGRMPDPETGKPRSLVGRINARPGQKGRNPSWSIAAPTEDEMETARKYGSVCALERKLIMVEIMKLKDEAAF